MFNFNQKPTSMNEEIYQPCSSVDLNIETVSCEDDAVTLELYRETEGTTNVLIEYYEGGEKKHFELPAGRRSS
jgi:hypothetical protein